MAKANGSLFSGNGLHAENLDQANTKQVGQKLHKSCVQVALRSPSGSNIVAFGTLTRIDKNAIAMDGLPLGEFYEVCVEVVVDSQGQATKLNAAIGRCIVWPFQNVV